MKFKIRVPATTANLGPGFDCLGLALDWWNTIEVETIARGLEVEIVQPRLKGGRERPSTFSNGVESIPRDATNLTIQAMRATFRTAKRTMPGLRVKMDCKIPIGRGLGSSAAAIVGGVVAANALLTAASHAAPSTASSSRFAPSESAQDGGVRTPRSKRFGFFSQDELLALAARIEGHPDNVAPALLGGLVVSVQAKKDLVAARLDVPRKLGVIIFVPNRTLSTKIARGVLPQRVPRADAIFNASRTAFWIVAVESRKWEWLEIATQDRLHQPYRAKLVRGLYRMFGAAMGAGARGVALSGAGPSVIAFTDRNASKIARAMEQVGIAGSARVVAVSNRGAHLT